MYQLSDINSNLNVVFDGQKSGDGVGITLGLVDNINSVTNITLNLMDDYGGLFEIDPTSNQIIVSDAALLSGVKTEDFTLSVSGSFDKSHELELLCINRISNSIASFSDLEIT